MTSERVPVSSAAALSTTTETQVESPSGWSVVQADTHLRMERRFGGAHIWLPLFGTLLSGALAVFMPTGVLLGTGAASVSAFLFGYLTLAGLVNRTTIEVGQGLLTVRHGPLPILRGREVVVSEIARLCVNKHVVQTSKGPFTTIRLVVEHKDGTSRTLLENFAREEQALFVARTIEFHLEP
jgi:hypothetical protein